MLTEKSGRTYYRMYRVWESDEDLVVPILRDRSYVETNMLIPQFAIDHVYVDEDGGRSTIESLYKSWNISDVETVKAFLEAYNQDILENPDLFIYQNDDLLGRGRFRANSDFYYYFNLDIYESMEHVMDFMETHDQKELLDKPDSEEIKSIEMTAYLTANYNNSLKVFFGLEEPAEEISKDQVHILSENTKEVVTAEAATQLVRVEETKAFGEYIYRAVIDKPEDINELMKVISVENSYGFSIFGPDYCNCDIVLHFHNGDTHYVQIKEGMLPEKFLEYFKME